jgi:phage tail-like protein
MPVDYPPVNFHFKVEFKLDGAREPDARFQEVSGLSAELGTEEILEGGENRFAHRLPTRPKYTNLVLKRGLLRDSRLIDWFRDALEGFSFEPVEVLVKLLNEAGDPLVSWSVVNARPAKWSLSDFRAQDGAVLVETIELCYDYFRRV